MNCSQCGKISDSTDSLCHDCRVNQTLVGDTSAVEEQLTLNAVSDSVPDLRQGDGPNKDFGDYELLHEIARGGMGVVYKVRNRKLNRIEALKMVLSGRFSSEDEIQRFHFEAEAAAQLDHPGIVPIYEIGQVDGQPFFTMKLIEGGSLSKHRDRIRQHPRQIAKLTSQIARAVHHAHQRGILHRDIKPANILLDEQDHPLVTDLGLAKNTSADSNLTQTGTVLGTPSYMPPEQAKPGHALTTAVDVYSIGAILYELLTGSPPHVGKSAMETVLKVMNDPIKPPREIDPEINRELELICMKCLQRNPEERYDSAADLADDLDAWLNGSPISVRPPSVAAHVVRWVRKNQSIVYAILLLLSGCFVSVPIMLSLLGSLNDPATFYENSERDPLPLLYSLTDVPGWLPLASGIFVLFMWPMLGLVVTLVTRPKTWKSAALNGAIVAATCSLVLVLSLGWVLLLVAGHATANDEIQTLVQGLWDTDEPYDVEGVKKRLEKRFPRVIDYPENQRANYVSNRVFAD